MEQPSGKSMAESEKAEVTACVNSRRFVVYARCLYCGSRHADVRERLHGRLPQKPSFLSTAGQRSRESQ